MGIAKAARLAVLALGLPLAALAGMKKEIPIGAENAVALELRDGWREEGAAEASTVSASVPGKMQLLVTAAAPGPVEELPLNAVQALARHYGPQSVEKMLEVREVKIGDAVGHYFTATDPAPSPGDYKFLRQGIVELGGARVTFTVLFNDGAEREVADAMAVVQAMRFGKRTQPLIASGVEVTSSEIRLSLPPAAPTLTLPREDWKLEEQRGTPNGGKYYMLTSVARRTVFSVYIEKTFDCAGTATCLEQALRNPQFRSAKDVQKSTEGPFSVARFFLDQPGGLPVSQANVAASAIVGGIWFDVRISRTEQERPDPAPLVELLRRIAVR